MEGCYLVPGGEACRRLGIAQPAYRSTRNGRGPRAWIHHWLVIPLHRADGSRLGFIWADEPEDRLLPSRPRLQALRLFANQATAAVVTARAVEELRFLADHDPLTRLGNRRAFTGRLEEEAYRGLPLRRSRSRSCCSTSTTSRSSTTATAMRPATPPSSRWPTSCSACCGARTTPSAWGATSSRCCWTAAAAPRRRGRPSACARRWPSLDLGGVAPPGASFGIALGGPGTLDPETLLRDADDALYAAKRQVGAAR